jgi:hypothetical protein
MTPPDVNRAAARLEPRRQGARSALMTAVYAELERMAGRRLRQERDGHSGYGCLDGFSHRGFAFLSAIVRSAGDEEANPKDYVPLLKRDDRVQIARGGAPGAGRRHRAALPPRHRHRARLPGDPRRGGVERSGPRGLAAEDDRAALRAGLRPEADRHPETALSYRSRSGGSSVPPPRTMKMVSCRGRDEGRNSVERGSPYRSLTWLPTRTKNCLAVGCGVGRRPSARGAECSPLGTSRPRACREESNGGDF